jgi:nitroreductase
MTCTDFGVPPPEHVEVDLRPDDVTEFRLGQLLLLLGVAHRAELQLNLERLGTYDFLAANPFLVIDEGEPDYRRLLLAGFSAKPLTYASSSHRFLTRRERLQHDLALLVAYGMVQVIVANGERRYLLTDLGLDASQEFGAIYAQAYLDAASLVLRRVGRMSDQALRRQLESWLKTDPMLLNLFE